MKLLLWYGLERVLVVENLRDLNVEIYLYLRLRQLETRNFFIMRSAPASFKVSIDGNVASAVYDSDLAESSISLSFCTVNHIY
jgi:hypothetical protein